LKKARYYRSGKLFPTGQLKADNVIYLITGRRENFRAIGSEVADVAAACAALRKLGVPAGSAAVSAKPGCPIG
jgi:hypothetical protein